MKKTSINILCCLILVILGASILMPAFTLGSVFVAGFSAGWQASDNPEASPAIETIPVDVSFNPEIGTLVTGSDTISFTNNETYPMIMSRAVIMVPEERFSSTLSWISMALYIICFVLFVFLMIEFIRFIININKGCIFDHKNIKRLKRFSYYLISIALLKCAAGMIEDVLFYELGLHIDGYTLASYWIIPWGTLLLGLLSLLMAQIWSRGLEMKEEQELTI